MPTPVGALPGDQAARSSEEITGSGRVALITGIAGQDGSYLAEQLIAEGWRVVGVAREPTAIRHPNLASVAQRIEVRTTPLADLAAVRQLLREVKPDHVFNFAARSRGIDLLSNPVESALVNGFVPAVLLEAMRLELPSARFLQASSAEVFARSSTTPQDESTRPAPRNPYGAAKAYADHLVQVYRESYSLFACSAILFNHESPRRPPDFLTRKITLAAAEVRLGVRSHVTIGDLMARRDWGSADEYTVAMSLMLNAPSPRDYVIATGLTHSVKDWCEMAFTHVGLDFRDHVVSSEQARTPDSTLLVGNPEQIKRELDWVPQRTLMELVHLMVDSDMAATGVALRAT